LIPGIEDIQVSNRIDPAGDNADNNADRGQQQQVHEDLEIVDEHPGVPVGISHARTGNKCPGTG